MEWVTHRAKSFAKLVLAASALWGLGATAPAHAAYQYTTIDYPGALCTQAWGINDRGQVVGNGTFSVDCNSATVINFTYNARTHAITVLPNAPNNVETGAIGINDAGAIVGSAGDGTLGSAAGFILRNGAFTFFSHPGWPFTQARAVSPSGVVTGFATDDGSHCLPFIYDPETGRFVDIVFAGQACVAMAQGINAHGDVVGNAHLAPGVAYSGSPGGKYSFRRDRRGRVTLFQVNGAATSARGINDDGRITGFFIDPASGVAKGFVTAVERGGTFRAVNVPAGGIVAIPNAQSTIPLGIDNEGRVSGTYVDAAGITHGFIATRAHD